MIYAPVKLTSAQRHHLVGLRAARRNAAALADLDVPGALELLAECDRALAHFWRTHA